MNIFPFLLLSHLLEKFPPPEMLKLFPRNIILLSKRANNYLRILLQSSG